MGILGKLITKAPIETFAKALANDIATRYPPTIDQSAGKQQTSVNRLTRIVEDACVKAKGFREEHRLGIVGKAKLGNAFRWELSALGYRKEFIDLAVEAVIVTISK